MLAVQAHTFAGTGKVRKYPFDTLQVGGQFIVDDPMTFGSARTLASRRSVGGKGFSCSLAGRVLIVTRYA